MAWVKVVPVVHNCELPSTDGHAINDTWQCHVCERFWIYKNAGLVPYRHDGKEIVTLHAEDMGASANNERMDEIMRVMFGGAIGR